jgi:hypothetical protein
MLGTGWACRPALALTIKPHSPALLQRVLHTVRCG